VRPLAVAYRPYPHTTARTREASLNGRSFTK
jgi:hypothetical protein